MRLLILFILLIGCKDEPQRRADANALRKLITKACACKGGMVGYTIIQTLKCLQTVIIKQSLLVLTMKKDIKFT